MRFRALPNSGRAACDSEECHAVYRSEWLPLRDCTIRGIEFPCPANSKAVLTRVYGKKWVTPLVDNPTDKHEEGQKLVKTIQNANTLQV